MIHRLVYGSIALLALITFVAVDARLAFAANASENTFPLIRYGSLIPLMLAVVSVLCVFELIRLFHDMRLQPAPTWCAISAGLLTLTPWLSAGGMFGVAPADIEGYLWQALWLTVTALVACVLHLRRGPSPTFAADLGASIFTIVYLGWFPSFAVQMRSDAHITDPVVGAWTVLIVLFIIFASDIGALYVGKAIGHRKLAPGISPGKSVEGFFGGIGASIVVAIGLRALAGIPVPEAEPLTSSEKMAVLADEMTQTIERLTLLQTVAFAAVMSVVSQVGDLFESAIKRSAAVKDSGRAIPGMGGLLDVVDGAIFAVPVAYFMLTKLWQVL